MSSSIHHSLLKQPSSPPYLSNLSEAVLLASIGLPHAGLGLSSPRKRLLEAEALLQQANKRVKTSRSVLLSALGRHLAAPPPLGQFLHLTPAGLCSICPLVAARSVLPAAPSSLPMIITTKHIKKSSSPPVLISSRSDASMSGT